MTATLDGQIKLVVGLGNPGPEYLRTRHNAGFMALDHLIARNPDAYRRSSSCRSAVWRGRCRGRAITLQKPETYMNVSGEAVKCMARSTKTAPDGIMVVFDDLDLPFGRLRIRTGGGDGGHKGVKSIIASLGSDQFARLRIGIGRQNGDPVDHVLGGFDPAETAALGQIMANAADAIETTVRQGVTFAMNQFNGATATPDAKTQDQPSNTSKEQL